MEIKRCACCGNGGVNSYNCKIVRRCLYVNVVCVKCGKRGPAAKQYSKDGLSIKTAVGAAVELWNGAS